MRKYVAILLPGLLALTVSCRDEVSEKFSKANQDVTNEVTFGDPNEDSSAPPARGEPSEPEPAAPGSENDATKTATPEPRPTTPSESTADKDDTVISRSALKQKESSTVIQEKRQIRIRKKAKRKPKSESIEIIKGDDTLSAFDSIPKLGGGDRGGLDSMLNKLESKQKSSKGGELGRGGPTFGGIGERDGADLSDQERRAAQAMKIVEQQLQGEGIGDPRSRPDVAALAAKLRKGRTVAPPKMPRNREPERLEEPPPPEELDGFENRTIETEDIVSKPMTKTATDPMSTFAIDVDTGAYTLARARLRDGYLPKEEDVRIEEFLNYFHYEYPQPKDGEFAVALEAAPDPFSPVKRHLLRVGVQGRNVADDERPPAHLTFLVDVSGSMFGTDKLELAREALELATRNLRSDDTVAIVTYAKGSKVQMWPAGAKEADIVLANIAALEPGGSSALDEGLKVAYEVASTHYYADHINRVVIMSDGRANVGATKPEALLRAVRAGVEDGVSLSTIGFGAKSFNDRMMERLADNGDGSYFFVDSFREAERVFRDRLCGTIHAIAQDVKIQVEFNPDAVLRHRLIGYENRKLKHHQFRDDNVDAGEIGAGHSVTALYELELAPEPAETIATVRVRHKPPGEERAIESNFQLWKNELVPDVRRASADFKFAAAVALFARVLKKETTGTASRISLIKEIASEGVPEPDNQPDRVEFLALVDEAAPYFEQ